MDKIKPVTEQQLQIGVVHHFRQVERMTGAFTMFHVPNGGLRSKRQAALFKAMGVMPGVSDLIFIAPGAKAIFVEMKAKKGHLSDHQKAFNALLHKFGFPSYVVTAAMPHEAINAVQGILKENGVI